MEYILFPLFRCDLFFNLMFEGCYIIVRIYTVSNKDSQELDNE